MAFFSEFIKYRSTLDVTLFFKHLLLFYKPLGVKYPIFIFFCCLLSIASFCQFLQISQEEIFKRSSLIVEGKVIAQNTFRCPPNQLIYTTHTIKVCKVFKGKPNFYTVEMITKGGNLGSEFIKESELLNIALNDEGVFFLNTSPAQMISPETGRRLYDVFGNRQGFIKYNLLKMTAASAFMSFNSVDAGVYPYLIRMNKQEYITIQRLCNKPIKKRNGKH